MRILQVHHALYIPTLLTRGFRELGHRADTVTFGITERVRDLTWGADFNLNGRPWAAPQHVAFLLWALTRYDVFHFWARPYVVPAAYNLFRRHFPFDLQLIKRAGKRISFQSDGCYAMVRPSVWQSKVDPEICRTCQLTQGDTYGFCCNKHTVELNEAMDRYADLRFGMGMGLDYEANAKYVFSPVDIERWRPDLEIPPEHRVEKKPGTVLVYHGVGSHVVGNRGAIKGTDVLLRTIDELKKEGYPVDLLHVENCPNNNIRFYQAQADIVVDQLLIGGGGQNARECLALGKPVLTRVHDQQWSVFKEAAAPHGVPPFVATDGRTLKQNLIMLINNAELRAEIGARSAAWARAVLAPTASASRYVEHFQKLYE